jgi:hypothetical protein
MDMETAHKGRGFFRTALDNLIAYRTTQRERFIARSMDDVRERTRHSLYLVR